MLSTLLNRKAWLISRTDSGEEDDYGNAIRKETTTEITCEVQQRQRSEDSEGAVSDTGWLGVFPAGTDLDSSDAIMVEGLGEFEVDGEPWPARNPRTGLESHVEASLTRTAGAEAGS